MQIKTPIQVTNREAAFENISAVGLLVYLLVYFFVMLVGDVANDLFKKILQRNDAFDASMFIDHKTEMKLLPLHLPKDILQAGRVNDISRLLQNTVEAKILRMHHRCHNVLAVNDAGNIIERTSINRQPRVTMLTKGG